MIDDDDDDQKYHTYENHDGSMTLRFCLIWFYTHTQVNHTCKNVKPPNRSIKKQVLIDWNFVGFAKFVVVVFVASNFRCVFFLQINWLFYSHFFCWKYLFDSIIHYWCSFGSVFCSTIRLQWSDFHSITLSIREHR